MNKESPNSAEGRKISIDNCDTPLITLCKCTFLSSLSPDTHTHTHKGEGGRGREREGKKEVTQLINHNVISDETIDNWLDIKFWPPPGDAGAHYPEIHTFPANESCPNRHSRPTGPSGT